MTIEPWDCEKHFESVDDDGYCTHCGYQEEIVKVSESDAIDRITKWLADVADLDDLAKIYSMFISNGIVYVHDESHSDAFEDGNRI